MRSESAPRPGGFTQEELRGEHHFAGLFGRDRCQFGDPVLELRALGLLGLADRISACDVLGLRQRLCARLRPGLRDGLRTTTTASRNRKAGDYSNSPNKPSHRIA